MQLLRSKYFIFFSRDRSESEWTHYSTVTALCFNLLCKTSKSCEGWMDV